MQRPAPTRYPASCRYKHTTCAIGAMWVGRNAYLHDTRGDSAAYRYEMEASEHIDLSAALSRCEGKVAISGYRNALMDRLYKGWRRFDAQVKLCHSIKKMRHECLWMNY